MDKRIRIALGGSEGRMGRVLREIVSSNDGVEIVCKIDSKYGENHENSFTGVESFLKSHENVDLYVDFTHPGAVIDNIRRVSEAHLDSVVGTTGWNDRIEEVKTIAAQHGRRIVYAPNFSPAVNALFFVTRRLARILGDFGYDVAVREVHHSGKVDAPSGTAITLGEILSKELKGRNRLAYERRRKRIDEEIDVSGVRVGNVAGQHEVWFTPHDSYSERLIVQHDSFNREAFGKGVLRSIGWLYQNNSIAPGLYSFQEDVLGLR